MEAQKLQPTGPPHVAILPSPGMGHLIPLSEFAKLLASRYGFTATFLVTDTSPKVKTFLDSLPESIQSVQLPTPDLHDLPPTAKVETIVSHVVLRSLPALRDIVSDLQRNKRLVALVVDLFGTDAFDVAKELGVPHYIFFPSTAMCLSLFHHLPPIMKSTDCEYRDLPEPIRLPGCVPIHGSELLDPAQDRKNDAHMWLVHHMERYSLADGILVNSFNTIESGAIQALTQPGQSGPRIYPVGPLIRSGSDQEESDSDCLGWLDKQPRSSVLFVSFGSGGTLSSTQLTELAIGLESSGCRFLWVVRSPSKTDESFFNSMSKEDPFAFLPEGFLERTKEAGMVVPSWAPQVAVLKHEATGGFLTHCGWNSTLESVVHGVPMIAWPLYAEQKMNSVLLSEGAKVAIRVKEEQGLVKREEVERVVKELMIGDEGKKIRARVKELKEEASKALGEGGSSYMALDEVVTKWISNSAAM